MNFLKSKLKSIITILSLATICLLMYLNLKPPTPPNLTASTPADKSTNILLLSPVSLQFDDVVESKDLAVVSDPPMEWRATQKASTIVSFDHTKPFKPNTGYSIQVLWQEKEIAAITFRTQQSETDYELLDRLHNEIKNKYPLAAKLPYTTNNFSVLYSADMTLEITPKETALTQEQMIAQVQDWVKQNGLDPASHKYVINSGTQTP